MTDMRLVRSLFLRLLGVVLLVAFVSLAPQVRGLCGESGLLPIADHLARAHDSLKGEAYLRFPTVFWLSGSDAALLGVCVAGAILAGLLTAGFAPLPLLFACWALYLSLVVAGQTFLSFQWDILLLETTFCALFVAPATWVPRAPRETGYVPQAGVWLLRLLWFKLMFLSGAVKLLSMDASWWELRALDVHYFTQPLPAWTAWYAHRLPAWFQQASVAVVLAIELVVPFLVFFGRRARALAAAACAVLMVAIAATGNYTFFNVLTLVLCLPLLDDDMLPDPDPAAEIPPPPPDPALPWRFLHRTGVCFLLLVSALVFVRELVRTAPRDHRLVAAGDRILEPARPLLASTDPFLTVRGYGLFRAMTTSRPEIVVEVSDDGRAWTELAFRYKPGDPGRGPAFVQPHQPRLDWQMWFAALAPQRQSHWLIPLTDAILSGNETVLGLLDDPPQTPPRFVRLVLYDYRFTTEEERERTGDWWSRRRVRELTGPLSR